MSDDAEMEEMQAVLDALEEDLRLERFDLADRWLLETDPDTLFPATVVAALSITFWGKGRLRQREEFLCRAEQSLRTRLGDDRAEELLRHRR